MNIASLMISRLIAVIYTKQTNQVFRFVFYGLKTQNIRFRQFVKLSKFRQLLSKFCQNEIILYVLVNKQPKS